MGDDRRHSAIPKLVEVLRRLVRDAEVAELHKQVARAFDDVAGRVGQGVLDIVVRQVKVAAQADFERIADEFLQMRGESLQVLAVVMIAIVGVRRGHHVRNPVGGRRAAQGDRNVPRFRAVVYLRKNVRMDVDHNCTNTRTPLIVALPHDLNRFVCKVQAARELADCVRWVRKNCWAQLHLRFQQGVPVRAGLFRDLRGYKLVPYRSRMNSAIPA